MKLINSLYPIVWRDLKLTFFNPLMLVRSFVLPILILVLFATGMSDTLKPIEYGGRMIPYFDFFFPGLLGIQLILVLIETINLLHQERNNEILVIVALSSKIQYFYIGKVLSSIGINILRLLVLVLIGYIFYNLQIVFYWKNIIVFACSVILGVWALVSVGFIIGCLFQNDFLKTIFISILSPVLVFTSNTYFMAQRSSSLFLRTLSKVNPISSLITLMRKSLLMPYESLNWRIEIIGVLLLSIILLPGCLFLLNRAIYKD